MTCFITKTTIPFGKTSKQPRVYNTLLNDHIWMLFDNGYDTVYPKIEMYKFKTGELKLEKVECVFPGCFLRRVTKLTSCQNHIYALVLNRSMYKLDVNTLQWEHLMGFASSFSHGPIIGNDLYSVEHNSTTSQTSVVKVNLTTQAVSSRIPCRRSHSYEDTQLMENNNEIYILENLYQRRTFVVSKIVNGRKEVLLRHHFNNIEGAELISDEVTNGHVLEDDMTGAIYLELFDFATNSFRRKFLPDFFREDTESLGNFIVMGNKLFVVFMENTTKETKYSIQMIELSPALSTICMLSQIDRTNNASDFVEIKENLSTSLRLKLDNILKWRIPENEIRLKKRQKLEAVQEAIQMENDGVVDHKTRRKLQAEFDSDFSDQSDSDIDGEYEPELLDDSDEERNIVEKINDERTMSWMGDIGAEDDDNEDDDDEDGNAEDDDDDDDNDEDYDDEGHEADPDWMNEADEEDL